MKDLNMKGIVFPIANYIGKTNDWDYNFLLNKSYHMNKDEIIDLYKNGWEIGSHGSLHYPYSNMGDEEIINDAKTSKDVIENIINDSITSFCIPFNYYSTRVIDLIRTAGFNNIFIQKLYRSSNYFNDDNMYYRHTIYKTTSKKKIRLLLEDPYREPFFLEKTIQFCSNATVGIKVIN